MLRCTSRPAFVAQAAALLRAASRARHHLHCASVIASTSGPRSPSDVLTFWFGEEWLSNRKALSTPGFDTAERNKLWWSGGKDTDAACGAFAELIHAAGHGQLTDGEWSPSPASSLAKVVLLDQLTRGAFRGTPTAFAYDAVAVQETLAAIDKGFDEKMEAFERQFLYMPLLHSEEHQDLSLRKFTELAHAFGDKLPTMKFVVSFAEEHAAVVKRFGRFPHRNTAKGRKTTPQEADWLASAECPGWAKSQQTK